MSSPLISISHQLFRCRYSNSRYIVASSPSFSCPAARAHQRACSQAIHLQELTIQTIIATALVTLRCTVFQVQTLVEMGFSRLAVLHALATSNNDITMATNILLSQS